MSPITEITYFQSSEVDKSGKRDLEEALALLLGVPGLVGSYFGHEIEEPEVVFWASVWENQEALDAFVDSPSHARIVELSRPAFGSEPTVHRVAFEQDVQGPLGAPITELVTFTLKEGASIAELERRLRAAHEALPGTPGFHEDSWGPVVGRPDVFYGTVGWDTVEAHKEASKTARIRKVIEEALEVGDLWLVHAALKRVGPE